MRSRALERRQQLELVLGFLVKSEGKKSNEAMILAARRLIAKVGITPNMHVSHEDVEDEAEVYEWCMGQVADLIDDERWEFMTQAMGVIREQLEIWRVRRLWTPSMN